MIDAGAFKAYDVRALYPSQLDEEGAYAVGRAFAEQFEPRRVAIGRDMRLSSPSMAEAVIKGVADAGTDVADLGMDWDGDGVLRDRRSSWTAGSWSRHPTTRPGTPG